MTRRRRRRFRKHSRTLELGIHSPAPRVDMAKAIFVVIFACLCSMSAYAAKCPDGVNVEKPELDGAAITRFLKTVNVVDVQNEMFGNSEIQRLIVNPGINPGYGRPQKIPSVIAFDELTIAAITRVAVTNRCTELIYHLSKHFELPISEVLPKSGGMTLLAVATSAGDHELVRLLVSLGADPSAQFDALVDGKMQKIDSVELAERNGDSELAHFLEQSINPWWKFWASPPEYVPTR